MIVSYWECLTHECGSTNFNNLSRHYWSVCDIRKRTRSQKVNGRTWHNNKIGGLNGDVSRKFYKDWDKLPDNSALTTREIAAALTKRLPDGTITYSCAKQKMKRLEAKGLVQRSVVRGLIHWLKVLKE